jgi:hypothetical protein
MVKYAVFMQPDTYVALEGNGKASNHPAVIDIQSGLEQ